MAQVQSDGSLQWVVFDPGQLGVIAWQTGSGRTEMHQADDALAAAPSAEAVLDGPMFQDLGSNRASSNFMLFDAHRSVSIPSRYPTSGGTIAVVPTIDGRGRAVATTGARYPDEALVAVQGYPTLVWNRSNVVLPNVNPEQWRRAALAILEDGRLAFIIGSGPMHGFAERVRALGAVYAVYTDGGGSTSLAVRGDRRYGSAENRAVAAWLGVWPSATGQWWQVKGGPAETAKAVVALALLGAGGAGLYYWIRKRGHQPAQRRRR